MDDDADDKDDSKRRTRNLSEKKRRDQFNKLINELSAMVCPNNRKMDKSSVLKSTISFLKNHNEVTVRSRVHDIQSDWKPTFLSNEEFTYLVLESLEAFVLVLSNSGNIYYVSESVTTLLGHNPGDVLNKSIFDFIFEEDRAQLYNILQDSNAANAVSDVNTNENEVLFRCHMKRGLLDFREEETYENVQFSGYFRGNTDSLDGSDGSAYDDDMRLLFICTGRLCTPQLIRDVSLVDATKSEFTSRHSLENFHFLFLDHRAPPIIGYLPLEVLGTSGYDYYHFDDLENVVSCHQALMQKGELTSCYYRFLTKGQQWIWLQTRFYITYHQWNSKPEFIVCTHRVVSYADLHKKPKRDCEIDTSRTDEGTSTNSGTDQRTEKAMTSVSYISETSDQLTPAYQSMSQCVKSSSGGSTVGTTATAGTTTASVVSWPRNPPHYDGSDTTSLSEESRSSHRRESTEMPKEESVLSMPQHRIGAQYLDTSSYVSALPVPAVTIPLHVQPVPVLVTPQQDQVQEQLQRKHEELQEMIVRQQEELRQVKEQLLLARLGMLTPLVNMPARYANVEAQGGEHAVTQQPYASPRDVAYAPHPPQHPPQHPHQHPHMPH